MSFLNGNNILQGNLLLPQYKWVKMKAGTVENEPVEKITACDVNGQHVRLYGAAVKYTAPQRTDVATDFAAFVQFGTGTFNAQDTLIAFTPVIQMQLLSATSGASARYGHAILDGANGMYRGEWATGDGPEPQNTDKANRHGLAPRFLFHNADTETCNTIRFVSYRQSDDSGMLEPGTTYEIWGLTKEIGGAE